MTDQARLATRWDEIRAPTRIDPVQSRETRGRERDGGEREDARGALTLRLREDGDAERPDVEEAEPDGGEAEGADKHQPPS